jgi:hypothetical protein
MVLSPATILRESVVPPRPVRNTSCNASEPAVLNQQYEPIHRHTLQQIPMDPITAFRNYIEHMGQYIDFTGYVTGCPLPMNVPESGGYSMRNEADVRQFADTFIVSSVRAVMLQMLPTPEGRSYNLEILSEARLGLSNSSNLATVDVAICTVEEGSPPKPLIMLEYKAPHVITQASVGLFRNSDLSEDWIKVTRQLRKYVAVSKCRHVICMDEKSAFYFAFPVDLSSPNEAVEYLFAQSGAASSLDVDLTVRELLVFALWNALGGSERRPAIRPYRRVTVPAQRPCDYAPLPHAGQASPASPRRTPRPRLRTEPRNDFHCKSVQVLERCSIIRMNDTDHEFPDGSRLDRVYTHVRIHQPPNEEGASWLSDTDDSGYYSEGSKHSFGQVDREQSAVLTLRPFRHNVLMYQRHIIIRDVEQVDRRIWTGTVQLLPSETATRQSISVVIKQFTNKITLINELAAYDAFAHHHLQGEGVPVCFGVFTLDSPGDSESWDRQSENGSDLGPEPAESPPFYLVLSCFDGGYDTVREQKLRWQPDAIQARVADAERLLGRIHAAGVLHMDLSRKNVLVNPGSEPGVAVVDFETAWRCDVECGLGRVVNGKDLTFDFERWCSIEMGIVREMLRCNS